MSVKINQSPVVRPAANAEVQSPVPVAMVPAARAAIGQIDSFTPAPKAADTVIVAALRASGLTDEPFDLSALTARATPQTLAGIQNPHGDGRGGQLATTVFTELGKIPFAERQSTLPMMLVGASHVPAMNQIVTVAQFRPLSTGAFSSENIVRIDATKDQAQLSVSLMLERAKSYEVQKPLPDSAPRRMQIRTSTQAAFFKTALATLKRERWLKLTSQPFLAHRCSCNSLPMRARRRRATSMRWGGCRCSCDASPKPMPPRAFVLTATCEKSKRRSPKCEPNRPAFVEA